MNHQAMEQALGKLISDDGRLDVKLWSPGGTGAHGVQILAVAVNE